MLVNTTAQVPEIGTAEYEALRSLVTDGLRAGVVSFALTASDLPAVRCEITDAEAIAYAVQGLVRMGVEMAEMLNERFRHANLQEIALTDRGVPRDDERRRAIKNVQREVFRTVRQRDWYHHVAFQATGFYRRMIGDRAIRMPVPAVSADVLALAA